MHILICDKCQTQSEPIDRLYSKPRGWRDISFTYNYGKSQNYLLCPACCADLKIPAETPFDEATNEDIAKRLLEIIEEIVDARAPQRD